MKNAIKKMRELLMTKSDIKKRIVIATLVSLCLVLFSLRTTFSTPGTPEFGDFVFHQDMNWIKSRFFTTWNPYFSSDNGADIPHAPWIIWMLLIDNSETATKLLLFMTLMVPSLAAFLVTYALTEKSIKRPINRYVAASSSSVFAIMNPVTVIHLSHYTYLWWTAGLFLVLYFTDKIVNVQNRKDCVKYILAGLVPFVFCTLAFSFYSLILTFIFIFCLVFFELLSSKVPIRKKLSNILLFVSMMTILMFLLMAYWFVPSWFGNLYSVYASGPQWMPKRTVALMTPIWRNNNVLETFRLTSAWNVGIEFFTEGGLLGTTWSLSTLILPILSVLTIILARRERIVRILAGIIVVAVVLGSLPHNPLRNQYLWVLENIGLISYPLDFPDYFLSFLVVAYCVLGGLFVGLFLDWSSHAASMLSIRLISSRKPQELFVGLSLRKKPANRQVHRYGKKVIGLSVVSMVIVFSFINGYPLVTGNLGGYFQPFNLPPSYVHMRDWLAMQQGTFRVIMYPVEPHVDWIPHRLASDFRRWVPTQPAFIPTGQTYDTILQNLIFYFLDNEGESMNNLGKLLNLANIRFVVYRGDMISTIQHDRVLPNLYSQEDLSLVFEDGPIKIFENNNWDKDNAVYAVQKAMIVVGGLDALVPMFDMETFNPNNFATVFLDQKPYSIDEMNAITSLDTTVVFYGDKNHDDFALGTIGQQYYHAPYDYLPRQGEWHGNSANVPWIGLYGIVAGLISPNVYGGRGEFDLGKGFIWTPETGATYNFNINIAKDDEYELWVRAFRSNGGGNVSFNINGHKSTVNMYGNPGFKWIRATTLPLNKGTNSFSIINHNGLNIVNLVATIPTDKMATHVKDVQNFLGKENVRVLVLSTSQYFKWLVPEIVYLKIDDIINEWVPEASTAWEGRLIPYQEEPEIFGKWDEVNGTLHSFGDAPYRFISGNETFSTDIIVARAKVLASNSASYIGFRAKDMANLYIFGLVPWSDYVGLSKFVNGSETVLNRYFLPVPVQQGEWYSLRVEAQGKQIKCYLDDQLVIDVVDETFLNGLVGLWAYNSEAYFKDVSIQLQTAINVEVPINSDYVLALATSDGAALRNIHVANQTLVGSQERGWEHFGSTNISTDTHIQFPRPIDTLAIYSVKYNNPRLDELLYAGKYSCSVEEEINPTNFQAKLDTASPSILIFSEKYYDLWEATSGNEKLTHFLVFSAYNGFLIPESGSHEITIKFNPEASFHIGIMVSALTLVLIVCSYIVLHKGVLQRKRDDMPAGIRLARCSMVTCVHHRSQNKNRTQRWLKRIFW